MMSKVDAAYQILKQSDKEIMTYKEIIEIAIAKGMIITKGKTPEQTLRVDIRNENIRRTKQNKAFRFEQLSLGRVKLIK